MGLLIDDILFPDVGIEENVSFGAQCMFRTSATVVSLFYAQRPYINLFYSKSDYMLSIIDAAILAEILKTSSTLPGLLTSIAISSIISCDLLSALTSLVIYQIARSSLDKDFSQLLSLASTVSLGVGDGTLRFTAIQTYKYFYLLFYYYFYNKLQNKIKKEIDLQIAVLAYLIYHLPTLPSTLVIFQSGLKGSYFGLEWSPDVAIISHTIFYDGGSENFYKKIPFNQLQYTELEDNNSLSNLAIARLRFGIYSYKLQPQNLEFAVDDFINDLENLLDEMKKTQYPIITEKNKDVVDSCEVVNAQSLNIQINENNGYIEVPKVKFDGILLDFDQEKEFKENKTIISFIEHIKNLGFIHIKKKTPNFIESTILDIYIKKQANSFSIDYFQTVSIPVYGQTVLLNLDAIKYLTAEEKSINYQLPKFIFGLFSAIFIGRFPPLLNFRVLCIVMPYYTFFDYNQAKIVYKNLILGNQFKEPQKFNINGAEIKMHAPGFANAGYLYSLALPALADIFLDDFMKLYTNSTDLNDFVEKMFKRGEFYFNYIYKKIREL